MPRRRPERSRTLAEVADLAGEDWGAGDGRHRIAAKARAGATDLAALGTEVLSRRLAALASATPGAWQTLQQQVRPHRSEAGLELSFAAELPGEQVALYLGYATPRKLLHFLMLCGLDRAAAIALFNATVPHFKPRLP